MARRWTNRYRAVEMDGIAASYDVVVVGQVLRDRMAAVSARTARSVLLVEASSLPREKSCGGMLNLYSRRALEPYGAVPEEMILDPKWIDFRYYHIVAR